MAESIVSDWLSDYVNIEVTELNSFIAQHENNHDVSKALFTILNERHKYPDVSFFYNLYNLFNFILQLNFLLFLFIASSSCVQSIL